MKASKALVLSALFICASLSACSEQPSETQAANGEAAEYRVTKADNSGSAVDVSAAGGAGAVAGAGDAGQNASAMPTGFAPYPGAVMGQAITTPGQNGASGGGMVTFEVAAKSKDVVAFYRSQMEANGMRVTKDGKSGIVHMLNGENAAAATKTISFQISPQGAGTKAQVIYSSK